MSINSVTLTGNLTRDPEMRGSALNISIAVNDRWKNNQTGEWEDRPNYIDCVCFGNRANALSTRLRKGQKVAVRGKLRWSQWDDKQTGKKRSKVDVIIDDLEFMGGGQGRPQQGYAPQPQQPMGYSAPPAAPAAPAQPTYDDIPF